MESEEAYVRCTGLQPAAGLRGFMVGPEVSPEFRQRLETAETADPWVFGFALVEVATRTVIGCCGFRAPPDADGMVEIGYGIAPGFQGQGRATEAARALVAFAFADERVRSVRAHTRPEANASARVLLKCGFIRVGEVVDPEDGPVWRWELERSAAI